MSVPVEGEDVLTPVIVLTRRAMRSFFVPRKKALMSVRPSFGAENVFVRDISPGGIGLITPHQVQVGDILSIQFEAAPWSELGGLVAKVAYVIEERVGSWRVGCAFRQALKKQHLHALLTECGDHELEYE